MIQSVCMSCSHVGDDKGRTHELEKNAIKCMRGLLFCYMRQSDKVRSSRHGRFFPDGPREIWKLLEDLERLFVYFN